MLYLVEPASGMLRFSHDAGIRDREARRLIHGLTLPAGVGLFGSAVARRELVTTGDYPADPRFTHSEIADRIVEAAHMRSMAAAPMLAGDEPLGALGAYAARADAFDEAQLALLQALADHAAVRLANLRLEADLRARADELAKRVDAQRTLGEIAARITALRDPADVLQSVVDAAQRLLASDGAHLTVPDSHGAYLRPIVVAGRTDAAMREWMATQLFPIGGGLNGLAAQRREAVCTEDYLVDPRIPHEPDDQATAERMGLRGMAVAPLRAPGGDVVGTLAISYRRPRIVAPDELELLQRLADQGAIALANAELVKQLEESRERYRFLVERSPDVVYETDAEGRFTFVSDAIEPMAGYAPAELLGVHFSKIIAPESLETIQEEWAALAARPDQERRLDFHLLRRDGTTLMVDTRGVGHLREGRFAGIHGSTRDISERIGLENDLRARTDQLARVVQAQRALSRIASQITAIRDPSTVLQMTVDEAARLLGGDGGEMDLVVPETGQLRLAYNSSQGGHPVSDELLVTGAGEGVSGKAVEERRVVRTGAYLDDASFVHAPAADAWARNFGVGSVIAAPLVGEAGALGALVVHARTPEAFDDDDAELLGALANQAAIAVTNARLWDDLGASERRYRFLVDQSVDIMWTIDAEGRWTYLSETIEPLTGFTPDELIGKHFASVIAPDSLAEVQGQFQAMLRNPGVERQLRYSQLRKDGSAMAAEARYVGMTDGAGRISGGRGTTRDVTAIDRLERDLRRQTEELEHRVEVQRALAAIAAQIAAIRDSGDVIQRTVDEAVRLLAAESGAIQQLTPDGGALVDIRRVSGEPLDPPELDVAVPVGIGVSGRAVREGTVTWTGSYLEDTAFTHAEATDRWVSGRGYRSQMSAPLVTATGPIGALTVYSPRAEAFDADDAELLGALADQAAIAVANARLYEQLEASERRYRHLVENSPDTIWSAAADGTLTYLSETIERLSGWKPEQLIGQHFSVLVHPDSQERMMDEWTTLVDPSQPERVIRFHLRHRDGYPIPAETTGIAEVAEGRAVGAHGAVRDIGERERLEVDLRDQAAELAASQERAALARELHDSVTQALFSMGLTLRSLELLLQADPQAATAKLTELRDLQKDALAEMRTLIFELRPKSLEEDGLEQALRTHAASVQGRSGLSVTVEADLGLPERLPIEVEEALYRIAQEALHNVVKHASAASVRILLARVGGEVRLSVADDGIGFDPANIPRGHIGIVGMRQRAEGIGAQLDVTTRLGAGTVVSAAWRIPDVPTAPSAE
jgi:PAS domain S-box-containing protein